MGDKKQVAIFDGKQIRRVWDDAKELWYFSVVDVVRILTDSVDAGAYWRKLKQRLKEEGSEVVTKCHGLKFVASDGKFYLTDAADTETMFRIIQSIPYFFLFHTFGQKGRMRIWIRVRWLFSGLLWREELFLSCSPHFFPQCLAFESAIGSLTLSLYYFLIKKQIN